MAGTAIFMWGVMVTIGNVAVYYVMSYGATPPLPGPPPGF